MILGRRCLCGSRTSSGYPMKRNFGRRVYRGEWILRLRRFVDLMITLSQDIDSSPCPTRDFRQDFLLCAGRNATRGAYGRYETARGSPDVGHLCPRGDRVCEHLPGSFSCLAADSRTVLLHRAKGQAPVMYVTTLMQPNCSLCLSTADSEDPSAAEAASVPMCACCFKTEDFPVPALPLESVNEGVLNGSQVAGNDFVAGVPTVQKSRAVGRGPAYPGT